MVDHTDAMQTYYALDKEHGRLADGVGRVEFERTVEVISRTLPPAPAVVADIGGGPGRYTDWLIDAGYTVIHRDVVPLHVDHIRTRHGERVDTALGDARHLDLGDASVDVVLLLGPLYHLYEEHERIEALGEALRVVKPGGYVHAAAISRWAARLHGMLVTKVQEKYPVIEGMIDQMEDDGIMAPIVEGGFTGYSHTPTQLREEVSAAGLALESLVALEGITFALADLDERMDDPKERALIMDTLRAVESVPDLVGLGTHLLASARRPR